MCAPARPVAFILVASRVGVVLDVQTEASSSVVGQVRNRRRLTSLRCSWIAHSSYLVHFLRIVAARYPVCTQLQHDLCADSVGAELAQHLYGRPNGSAQRLGNRPCGVRRSKWRTTRPKNIILPAMHRRRSCVAACYMEWRTDSDIHANAYMMRHIADAVVYGEQILREPVADEHIDGVMQSR